MFKTCEGGTKVYLSNCDGYDYLKKYLDTQRRLIASEKKQGQDITKLKQISKIGMVQCLIVNPSDPGSKPGEVKKKKKQKHFLRFFESKI